MTDYLQPDFYRFNSDSLDLLNFLRSMDLSPQSILDLGAGCGILGIELARHFRPGFLAMVEMQPEFLSIIETNIETFLPKSVKAQTFITPMSKWNYDLQFDLVVCNPPYYLVSSGQASPDPRRSKCRTFEEDGWKGLISCIERSLLPVGKCFIVIKDDPLIMKEFERQESRLIHQLHKLKGIIIIELTRLHEN